MMDVYNLIGLVLFAVLIIACALTWRKQNRDIDELFRETADTRTHVFFLLFEDKPDCLSIEDANKQISEAGKINISGRYNGFPLSVSVITDGDYVRGHTYSVELDSDCEMTVLEKDSPEQNESAGRVQEVIETKSSTLVLRGNSAPGLDAIAKNDRFMEILEHLFKHSSIDSVTLKSGRLSLADSLGDAGSKIVRARTIFEVLTELATLIQARSA